MRAYTLVTAMREATVAACQRFDYVPIAHLADPRLRGGKRRAGQRSQKRAAAHRFHRALQHVGATAASVNWSWSADGLPIGIQLIGKRFDDSGVLKLARLIEKLRPLQRPWPE